MRLCFKFDDGVHVDNGNDNVPDNGSDDVYDYDDYDIASLGKYIQNGNGRHPLCSF